MLQQNIQFVNHMGLASSLYILSLLIGVLIGGIFLTQYLEEKKLFRKFHSLMQKYTLATREESKKIFIYLKKNFHSPFLFFTEPVIAQKVIEAIGIRKDIFKEKDEIDSKVALRKDKFVERK